MLEFLPKKKPRKKKEITYTWKFTMEFVKRFSEFLYSTVLVSVLLYVLKSKVAFFSARYITLFKLIGMAFLIAFTVYTARASLKHMHHHAKYYAVNFLAYAVFGGICILVFAVLGNNSAFDMALNVTGAFSFLANLLSVNELVTVILYHAVMAVVIFIAPEDWFYYVTRNYRKKMYYKKHPEALNHHHHHHHHHSDGENKSENQVEYIEEIDSKFIKI